MDIISSKTETLYGEINCPGDKSISQRAVILSGLLNGDLKVKNFLFAADPLSTLNAMRELGLQVTIENEIISIHAKDSLLKSPKMELNLGNSGTGIRLISGLIGGLGLHATLTGDDSLSKRPMKRITKPLSEMGINIFAENNCPPLQFKGAKLKKKFRYHMPVASAQLKSCLLLAAVAGEMELELVEPVVSRNHTELMLQSFGANICSELTENGHYIKYVPERMIETDFIEIVGDFSSAAFFIIAGLITPESDIRIKGVGINPSRAKLVEILLDMGAKIELVNSSTVNGEMIADLKVQHSELQSINISPEDVPVIIDEIPILLIAAIFAKGKTTINGAEELRVKESDRLAAMEAGLKALGVQVSSSHDSIDVEGNPNFDLESVTIIDSFGDHRIAMSFLVLGQRIAGDILVKDCNNIQTSYPDFMRDMIKLGGSLEEYAK